MRPINPKKNFFKLAKADLASLGSFFLIYFFDKNLAAVFFDK